MYKAKGQKILKQNFRGITSPKKQTKRIQDTILSAFCSFFWEKLWLDNFVSIPLQIKNNIDIGLMYMLKFGSDQYRLKSQYVPAALHYVLHTAVRVSFSLFYGQWVQFRAAPKVNK